MSSLSIHTDPDGPGSVTQAPNLPAGFTETFSSRYIDANGIRQHVVIGGDGPPVLLVHGWPENWYAWRLVMPALAENYTVIAVDQRGIGLTEKPTDGYDAATAALESSSTSIVGSQEACAAFLAATDEDLPSAPAGGDADDADDDTGAGAPAQD